jgi:diguanylate cyclase (GGDEF)-like protein
VVVRAAADSAVVQVGVALDSGTLAGQAYLGERTIRIDSANGSPGPALDALERAGGRSAIASPLTAGSQTIGALTVVAPSATAFTDEDEETVGMLARFATHQVLQAQRYEEAQKIGRRDPLTGLGNRRALDECLHTEMARHTRYGRTLSLCLVDLDGFKKVNDTLGHQEGDRVLIRVAQRLCEIRGADGAFRLGGDEFAVVLPETPATSAELVARRLARAIREDVLPVPISASWGVAEASGTDATALLAAADAQLYERKRETSANGTSQQQSSRERASN